MKIRGKRKEFRQTWKDECILEGKCILEKFRKKSKGNRGKFHNNLIKTVLLNSGFF